jgi:hypothetical protein
MEKWLRYEKIIKKIDLGKYVVQISCWLMAGLRINVVKSMLSITGEIRYLMYV